MLLNAFVVLALAALAVAVVHSAMPDHWVPLAIVARSNRWSIARTARISLIAALGHVGASLVLGMAIGAVGPLREWAAMREGRVIGVMLIATGAGLYVYSRLSRRPRGAGAHLPLPRSLGQFIVPFGVAASPNLAIVPVALASAALGWPALLIVLLAFTAGTLVTFLVLSVLGTVGGYLVDWPWLERSGDSISAALLAAIGLVAFFAL
ncbi:MAG: hypothetical protein M0Z66_00315 [Thermaerobacter sp.]|nr:hypothetical protein [Thermaerobacter sp.]